MKKSLYITICFTLLLLLTSCSLKTYHIDSSLTIDDIAILITKNTPNLCSYRGKAAVKLDGSQNISFSVLLNKKCNDDALINVLGALNNPLASIRYENKKVEVHTQNNQNTEDIKKIADKSIFHIISFFKTPQRVPDSTNYSITFTNSSYIFTDTSGSKLYADDKFRLYKYITGSITSEYIWDEEENILKSIIISSPDGKVTIKFLNKLGWGNSDDK